MSRVIVKNLPKTITEDKLRSIFGEKGQITDVQLKYTKEGVFRQFAFIGFHAEHEAAEAIKHFDQTRINTSKIQVQECATLGDEKKPKSWSKYASDSSAYKKAHKKEKTEDPEENEQKKTKKRDHLKELLEKYKDDPKFEEFLEVHNATRAQEILKSAKLGDSDQKQELGEQIEQIEQFDEENDDTKLCDEPISDKDYLKQLVSKGNEKISKGSEKRKKTEKKQKEKIDLFTLKLKNLPYTCKKKQIKDFLRPSVPYSIRIPRNIKGIAFIGFKTEQDLNRALSKDKSIISGKQIFVTKYINPNSKDLNQNEEDTTNSRWKTQEESLKNEEDIAESGRIFIRNLSYTTTEDDIQSAFEKYGPIAEISLPIDSTTRKMKGFGVVTYMLPEHAVKAYVELDGSILQGRMVHLLPGKAKDGPNDSSEGSTNYKDKKLKQQKSLASNSYNWNSLFLGHDAVAEVIAKTYSTTKEAVLDPHGDDNAAVRLALGETQIVATTRKYLEDRGVVLDSFNQQSPKRSKTAILVKNLPANTESHEIRGLFEKHGVIGNFIFPPSGISAIVDFVEPSEAKKAYVKLAYSKFKHLPLYLEWAPENVLSGTKSIDTKPVADSDNKGLNEDSSEKLEEKEESEEDEEEEPEPDTTLFVKNLDFKVTDNDLREHFLSCGKLSYATVAMRKSAEPGKKLSMGYGFVRYMHKASLEKALKTLQNSSLLGKSLELKRSERVLNNEVDTLKKKVKGTKQTGTKILVRNIPFQAKKQELFELFKVFGDIRALRMPMKMSQDSHRGFAFVDFTTNSIAKKAFEALCQSTHLYGRRLVLEWASVDEDVDEIRKRTADQFYGGETNSKKFRKSVLNVGES